MRPGTNRSRAARRPRTARAQRGMSMTATLAALGVAVFIGMFAFKAGPAYFEAWRVQQAADNVAADADLMRSPRSKVYKQLATQYQMNDLWNLRPEDTIELKKDGERGYAVRVAYEKRETLFGNIDLVMRFDREASPQ